MSKKNVKPTTPAARPTPGPWHMPIYAASPADVERQRKAGLTPAQALMNDGSRFIMAGTGQDMKRVALVDCQTDFKRGKGHLMDCAERDANGRVIAKAPEYEAMVRDLLALGRKKIPATDDEARQLFEIAEELLRDERSAPPE